MDRPLTLKQELFVEYYLGEARGNATEAARLAGYSGDDNTLHVTGANNLKHPTVAARIAARVNEVAATTDEILAELRAVAFAPTSHFMQVVRPAETDADGTVISPMIVRQDYSAKVRALELLGKNLRLFSDVQIDVNVPKAFIGIDLDRV